MVYGHAGIVYNKNVQKCLSERMIYTYNFDFTLNACVE